MSLAFFVIILSISCSKDSDLFDSQISEQIESVRQFERGAQDMGELLAFPGAMGFGRNTTGGRGGRVIHVTNLNDSGPGSLREALETSGPRIIVFDVGGTIDLTGKSTLKIGDNNDSARNTLLENVTIAGETAPYPGILITGNFLDIYTSNVIVRYITVRPGRTAPEWADGLRIKNFSTENYIQNNIIIDHCSISHGIDENVSFSGYNENNPVIKVTFSNNIMGKVLGNNGEHRFNLLRGPHVYELTLIENYFGPSESRNPLIGYGAQSESVEVINNIAFGDQASFEISRGNIVDGIANIYKSSIEGFRFTVFSLGDQAYGNPKGSGAIYISDNIIIGSYQNGVVPYNNELLDNNQSSRVIENSLVKDWAMEKLVIEDVVLKDVGNSLYRDSLDKQLVNEYYLGKGDFVSKAIVTKTSSKRNDIFDTDNDGMADEWEMITYGTLDKKSNGDENENGYSNIEEYFYYIILK
jgi:hypothetical protein